MNKASKTKAIITSSLVLLACMSTSPVNAQQTVIAEESRVIEPEALEQASLDQILAPIALYPDSVLSQILVASTYPLEVVQAARWRQANTTLTEDQVLAAIEDMEWDPSVKALTPFTDLIARLSQDLNWLQQVGDAFLQNEYQVIASVQGLRQKAYDNGSIADNDYYDVVTDNDNIIIESANEEIVHVPYYDSRVVYGRWGWNDYQPVYWHHPSSYRLHAGFYWSDRFYIRPTIFFGGFRWGSRNLVVNHHFYDRPYSSYNSRYRNIGVSNYRRWSHNPRHRRGVRYSRNSFNKSVRHNQVKSRSIANKQSRNRMYERGREGNRYVSKNNRNRTNINRAERRRVQKDTNRRVQRSGIRTTRNPNVARRDTNRRTININRSNSRQQSENQSRRDNAKVNNRNNRVNSRSASTTKVRSHTTNINRNKNSNKKNKSSTKRGDKSSNERNYTSNKRRGSANKSNYKSNNRSYNRTASKARSRFNLSNKRSHKQRN